MHASFANLKRKYRLDETTGDDADREGTPSNLSELIALRKLRQSIRKSGTDVEKVNAATGDAAAAKRRKRKAAEDSAPGYGLQTSGSKDAGDRWALRGVVHA